MKWAVFFAVVACAMWLEESETRRAEACVTMVVLLAVLAFLEIVDA